MAIGVSYTIRDAKGAKSTSIIHLPSATTLADAQEFALEMGDLIAALTSGSIIAIGINFSVSVAGLTNNNTDPNSDVEEGGKFIWSTVNGYTASNRLPTFLESKIVSGTKLVDESDAAVLAFTNAMVDGLTMTSTNVVQPCDYRGDDIDDLTSALEAFQASRKLRGI